MVRKRKSLAEELANLADPAPAGDFDPEDLDFRTGNAGDEVAARDDSDDDDELRPIEVGRSALRMANAMSDPSLKQGAYAGTVRKRQRTAQKKFGDDINEADSDSSADEEHEGENESEGDDDVEIGEEDEEDEDEDEEEEEDEDEDEEDQEGPGHGYGGPELGVIAFPMESKAALLFLVSPGRQFVSLEELHANCPQLSMERLRGLVGRLHVEVE